MIDLYDKKVKEHIGFHYLLTETQELEILLRIEYVPKEVLKNDKYKYFKDKYGRRFKSRV